MKKTDKIYFRGFTVIELLVVIAIIGLLSGAILVSVRSSREKGIDAAIISNILNTRAQAEIFYQSQTPNAYMVTPSITVCHAPHNSLEQIMTSIITVGGNPICGASDKTYVLYSSLVYQSGKYFCIDQTGTSEVKDTRPGYGSWGVSGTGDCENQISSPIGGQNYETIQDQRLDNPPMIGNN
jgi:prepilin-type N-terminal cleavage/methylation domain-containing protein